MFHFMLSRPLTRIDLPFFIRHTTRRHTPDDPTHPPSICLAIALPKKFPRQYPIFIPRLFLARVSLLHFIITSFITTNKLTTSNKLRGVESFLRSHQLFIYSRIYQRIMELEGSLPCSKKPLLVSILSQNNPVYATPCCLSEIHFNRIFPKSYRKIQFIPHRKHTASPLQNSTDKCC
jgi:hypothetical protein